MYWGDCSLAGKDSGKDNQQLQVFISYSHKDKRMKDRLMVHLMALERQLSISVWHDGCLKGGETLDEEVLKQLRLSDVVLMLISPDYIASKFCFEIEMEQAIARHNRGECIVIPVIFKDTVNLDGFEQFSKLVRVPKDGFPIASFKSSEAGHAQAANMIGETIKSLLEKKKNKKSNPSRKNHKPSLPKPDPEPGGMLPSPISLRIYQDGTLAFIPATQHIIEQFPTFCERLYRFTLFISALNNDAFHVYQNARRRGNIWWGKRVRAYLFEMASYIRMYLLNIKGTRVHFRRLEQDQYLGVVAVTGNRDNDIKQDWSTGLTPIPNHGSMICAASDCDAPLIKSYNQTFHHGAMHDEKWVDYLTCVFKHFDMEQEPILSLGISIDGSDYAAQKELLILLASTRIDKIIHHMLIQYCDECRQIDGKFDLHVALSSLNFANK